MKQYLTYYLLISVLLATACKKKLTAEQQAAKDAYALLLEEYQFPYKLDAPDKSYALPNILREISGLGITPTGELGCVQDERGIIFIYDTEEQEINRRIAFAKDADYEGVTFAGEDAFVLRNNGNIYRVSTFDTGKPDKEKYRSLLNKKNNTKGIGYEPAQDRILVVCKDGYGASDDYREQLAVFAYAIDSNTVSDSVIYSVNLEDIKRYLTFIGLEKPAEKYPEFYSKLVQTFPVYPSAIAVHPQSGNIYISSTVGRLLFVLHPNGQLIHIARLQERLFLQPEGIAIKKDGTLFIASEGKTQPGTIREFKMK